MASSSGERKLNPAGHQDQRTKRPAGPKPMFSSEHTICVVDPEVWQAIKAENKRQHDHIELIASENYASPAVMEAQGSQLTNKYAEGYPGKRYYGGCEFVDIVEQLAIDRVKKLFGADAVQRLAYQHKPRMLVAGASSYSRVIDWGRLRSIADSVNAYLFVDMAHYAGLIVAKLYPNPVGIADFVTSTTHKTMRGPRGGFILANERHAKALNSIVFPGLQGGPLMHLIAAKAVAFQEALDPAFHTYQRRVRDNARTMAHTLGERGLRIVSGGTDSHMFLVDLRAKKITGKDAEAALGRANITINKNAIPNDPEKPFVTSGLRFGSAAMMTRGFGEEEAAAVAHLVADVLEAPDDAAAITRVAGKEKSLCDDFPVYGSA
jgi:glycine/serine hydroxymethyltransferase